MSDDDQAMRTIEQVAKSVGATSSTISKIKLHGGMVGKVSLVLIFVALAFAAMSWAVHEWWISLIAIVLLFILVLVISLKMISFAEKHPQAALMEGAEFLLHEQLQLGMKSHPVLPADPALNIEPVLPPPGVSPPLSSQTDVDETGEEGSNA